MKDERQKTVLNSADICAIIKASAEAKILVLKFGDLYIRLGGLPAPEPEVVHASTPTPATDIAEPNHETQSKLSLELDELRTREDEIAELLITDPMRAEELIRDGELEEINDGRDDFEET